MNGTVNRRVFVGSLAGAGVGALGASSLDFSLSAQRASTTPLLWEVRRQIKEAIGKIRDGQSGGAKQLATVMRLYASTVNDAQLQTALRNANRQQLLLAEMNHGELVRQAEELGINPSTLPPHSLDRGGREVALDRLIKEGLSPLMLHVADFVDELGAKMEGLERTGRATPLQVALRQPIPDEVDCGDCEKEAEWVKNAEHVAVVTCAAALVFPIFAEACAAATATYLTFHMAYSFCLMIVRLCEYYYGK